MRVISNSTIRLPRIMRRIRIKPEGRPNCSASLVIRNVFAASSCVVFERICPHFVPPNFMVARVVDTAVESRLTKNDRVNVACGVRVFVGDAVRGSWGVTVVRETESELECVSVSEKVTDSEDEPVEVRDVLMEREGDKFVVGVATPDFVSVIVNEIDDDELIVGLVEVCGDADSDGEPVRVGDSVAVGVTVWLTVGDPEPVGV